jgi:hypothetical protein
MCEVKGVPLNRSRPHRTLVSTYTIHHYTYSVPSGCRRTASCPVILAIAPRARGRRLDFTQRIFVLVAVHECPNSADDGDLLPNWIHRAGRRGCMSAAANGYNCKSLCRVHSSGTSRATRSFWTQVAACNCNAGRNLSRRAGRECTIARRMHQSCVRVRRLFSRHVVRLAPLSCSTAPCVTSHVLVNLLVVQALASTSRAATKPRRAGQAWSKRSRKQILTSKGTMEAHSLFKTSWRLAMAIMPLLQRRFMHAMTSALAKWLAHARAPW